MGKEDTLHLRIRERYTKSVSGSNMPDAWKGRRASVGGALPCQQRQQKLNLSTRRFLILVVALAVVALAFLEILMMSNVTASTSSTNGPLLSMPMRAVKIQGPQLMRSVSYYTSLYPVSLPILNVGISKMGSTTLQHFLQCAGFLTSHFYCNPPGSRPVVCGPCMLNAVKKGKPPLASCGGGNGGHWHAFTEMNDHANYPQWTILPEIHNEVPNATFVLIQRNITEWERSVTRWRMSADGKTGPFMRKRMTKLDLPDLPAGIGGKDGELGEWFRRHVLRVREFVRKNPSHKLVEVDLEDVLAGEKMGAVFGTNASCWGHKNKNLRRM